jgi:hypothetical protein
MIAGFEAILENQRRYSGQFYRTLEFTAHQRVREDRCWKDQGDRSRAREVHCAPNCAAS